MSDKLILWYGVFTPDGQLFASSSETPIAPLTSFELETLRQNETVSRSNIAEPGGKSSPTTAEAFHTLSSGDVLLGYVGVRVSRAEAGPLLDRFLQIAFAALCVLVVLIGGFGILLLRRYLYNQSELERRLITATENLNRSEEVANVGHWSALNSNVSAQWSPQMYAIYGQDPETFVPTHENVLSCLLPEERKKFQNVVDRMNAMTGEMDLETRIQRPDGAVRHVYAKGSVEKDSKGSLVRLFGVTQDITERKEADLVLARNEDMLDRAIEATGAAIWDWDIIEDHLFTTPRLAEILGADPETWQPSMALHYQWCHPDDVVQVRQALQDHLEEGVPYNIEYRLRRTDESYVWVHSRGRGIKDEHGIPMRVVGSITGITKRREEQELLKKNQETLDLAIKAAEAGFFDREWDQEGIYWSPRLKEILGITD